jgi:hypothetical protein
MPATVDSKEFHVLFIKHGIAYQLIQTNYFNDVFICLLADRRLRGSLRRSMAELTCGATCTPTRYTYENFEQLIRALRFHDRRRSALPQIALLFSFTNKECTMHNLNALETEEKIVLSPEKPTLIAVDLANPCTLYDTSFYNEAHIAILRAHENHKIVAELREEYLKECKCNIALEINCKTFQDRCTASSKQEFAFDFYAEITKQDKKPIKQQRCEVL